MTPGRLVTLIVLALLTIGVGTWLANRQMSTPASAASTALYPELKGELDAVNAVRLFKAGDARAVELLKSGTGWTVTEREGYSADQAKIGKLLRSLADAKPQEEKTSNPESYPALGVEETSDAKASGVRIELGGTSKPVNLIVGKQGTGAQATYVRKAGEPTSWLVNVSIDSSSAPQEWLRKEVLDISADRIQSAVVNVAGAKPYTVAKATRADQNFAVTGLPKGKELTSPAAPNSIATALLAVTLADVRPRKEFETTAPSAHAVVNTFDGLVAELDGWKKDDKHFIAAKLAHDPTLAERFHIATTTPGQGDAKPGATPPPAPEPKPEDNKAKVEEEVKTSGAQLSGWTYEIPGYKYDAIFKPLDDLLKKDELPKKK